MKNKFQILPPPEIDRNYFAKLYLELEKRIDVNAIQISGVKIWPMIRLMLASNVKRPGGVDTRDLARRTKRKFVQSKDQNYFQRLLLFRPMLGLKSGSSYTAAEKRTLEIRKAHKFLEDQFCRLRKNGAVEFIVMTKSEKYYQEIGYKRFAPIEDTIYEDLLGHGSTMILALEPIEFECVHPPFRLDIDPHMILSKTISELNGVDEARRYMEEINRVLTDINKDFKLDIDAIIKRYRRVLMKREFWYEVFSILRPKAVFVSSFIGWNHLIWACRDLGIVTIDVQHGGQSPFHNHTTHWSTVPKDGYPMLPDFFWVWGETTANYIRPWLPGNAKRHKVLVGGNRNLAHWMRNGANEEPDPIENSLDQLSKPFKKRILVTLSYGVENIMSDCIIEAMRLRPDWFWFLRLHPLKRAPEVIKNLSAELGKYKLKNFEISNSTNVRLFGLFRLCHYHVTPFSTTNWEALAIGIPTTIVHPIGLTYFSGDISAGIFDYADSGENLVNSIETFRPQDINPESILATDNAYVKDAIREIREFAEAERTFVS